MAGTQNYTWDQGADLIISLIYQSGPAGSEAPVNLTTWQCRMDIAAPDGTILTVLNDEAITDADPFTPGNQADNLYEVVLGSDGSIVITLSRALTLPGGAFNKYISANPSQNQFEYDIFLRSSVGKQSKILQGTITLVKSVTKWQ